MKRTVLIIDDDPELVDAIQTLLEANGYAVQSAPDGAAGVAKAAAAVPDLIILDVMMTGKTEGFDTARKLKETLATKTVPIVMVTGVRKEMNVPFAIEPDDDWLPVKAFLEKPVKPEVLLKTVADNIGAAV